MSSSRLIPLIIASALFMENMDSTVIATSLPAIARSLGTDPIMLKLAFTTYLLSLTVFIPVSGWLADRFGSRHVFRVAIAVFTLGSLACGMASSLGGLVAARALQGIGGAMMVPVGRIILLRTVPKAELVDALAWLTIPALIGPLVGPPVGGFITDSFGWRWVFWMNLPFGILAFVLATVLMPEIHADKAPKLDAVGFLLSGLGLSSFIFGLTIMGRDLLPGWTPTLLMVLGAVLAGLYVRHARRTEHPILDLSLLRIETFRAGVVGGSLFRVGVGAVPFLLPLMFQLAYGMSAFQSGMITFVAAAGAISMKLGAAKMIRRFGFRKLLLVNGVMASVSISVMGLLSSSTPYLLALSLLFAGGFLRSLQFTALNAMSYSDVDHRQVSYATSLYTVAQQLSLSLGVVFAAFVLEAAQWWRADETLTPMDFTIAFAAVAACSLTACLQFLALSPGAGEAVSGKKVAA
ncbi:DHA2 family efflux MFS transporter permease subunit [Aestuariivirga sp.]|uniref:DHA2 family efflux MFS transporter permease subunit n=1 Tax=Aestuariivirga sp. TaxID=2650926 RepID=UPI0025B87A59|nr:DHA2 family efflux MFS transporter permease subunit [Aestuariivirga sp.]MCA3556308.1 DHA2 family efflux MFS transporter permease subunit [Aestuariivirga sp.]